MPGEQTEKATPKRRQDERKKGNVFQSKDVVTVLSMTIMFYAINFMAPTIYPFLTKPFHEFFSMAGTMKELTHSDLASIFLNCLISFCVVAGPFLLLSGALSVLLTGMQTRFLVSWENIKFKGNKLNPLSGFKRMFSLKGIVELIKSIVKISVLGWIVYDLLLKRIALLPRLLDMSVQQALVMLGETIITLVTSVVTIFVFIAAADFLYQWWEYEKNLRMSKQDIKDEYKQSEGDPQIKGKIKQRQQQMSQKRMMQDVPKADVVIRNPTHFAVAIAYDTEKNRAPIVLAKGADRIALKIIELAEQNGVHVTENRPLARGLYESVEIGWEIPEEFYQAVAGVLAFVYALKNKKITEKP